VVGYALQDARLADAAVFHAGKARGEQRGDADPARNQDRMIRVLDEREVVARTGRGDRIPHGSGRE
jgi:hypothetical protein